MSYTDDMPKPPNSQQQGSAGGQQVQQQPQQAPAQGGSQSFTSDMPQPPQQQATPGDLHNQAVQSQQQVNPNDPSSRYQAITDSGNSIAANTMAFVDTFNKQMGSWANGILQGVGLGDTKAAGGMSANEQQAQNEQAATAARLSHPWAAGAGDVAGVVGNAVMSTALGQGIGALGGVAANTIAPVSELAQAGSKASLLARTAASAGQGALYGGSQYVDPGQSRGFNTGVGGVIGAAAPAVGDLAGWGMEKLGKAYNYIKTVQNPEGMAMANTVAGLKNVGVTGDSLQAAVQPAQNLGHTLSLGEALGSVDQGSPVIATAEGRLGTGSAEDIAAANQHLQDTQSIKGGLGQDVLNTINSIVPEGDSATAKAAVDQGYTDMRGYSVSPEQLQALQSNPTIGEQLSSLNKPGNMSQADQALPDSSVYKLEQINRNINSTLDNNAKNVTLGGVPDTLSPNKIDALNEAKAQLQPILSSSTPVVGKAADGTPITAYDQTLDLAGRNSQRNDMLNVINKAAGGAQSIDPDGSVHTPLQQMYNQLWKTPAQQDKFLGMIQSAGGKPEDVQAAKDMIYTVNHTINSPVSKILSGTRVATDTTATSMGKESLVKQAASEITSNNYKRAMLQITLGNGDGHQALIEAMKAPSLGEKLVGLNNVLKYVTGNSAVKATGQAISASQPVTKAVISGAAPLAATYQGMAPAILGGNSGETPNLAGQSTIPQ